MKQLQVLQTTSIFTENDRNNTDPYVIQNITCMMYCRGFDHAKALRIKVNAVKKALTMGCTDYIQSEK